MRSRHVQWLYTVGIITVGANMTPTAAAQSGSPIGTGSWIIGGSGGVSASHNSASDQTTTSFRLAPTALRFVRPGLAVGGTTGLSYSSSSTINAVGFELGPSARYYFGDPSGQLFPFVSASVLPSWTRFSRKGTQVSTTDVTNRTIAIDGSVGLTRLIATYVGLTGEAYYTHLSLRGDVGSITNTQSQYDAGLRFGITVFVH